MDVVNEAEDCMRNGKARCHPVSRPPTVGQGAGLRPAAGNVRSGL